MRPSKLKNIFIEQNKDLIWMIDLDFKLIYANKAFQNVAKEINNDEIKLNESIFNNADRDLEIEKWKTHYFRAFKGESFEIQEHYFNLKSNETEFIQVTFEPFTGDDDKIIGAACVSRNITKLVQKRSEANQLIDASLDVFCTISEDGKFAFVSAASVKLWGYTPEELIGTPYRDLILEEDVAKTNEIAATVLYGNDIKSFVNRYKKKEGGIAYNSWSIRWDEDTKLIYCVARDNKEKIKQEEKIQKSEQRFKALVQEGSDLIGIVNAEGNYIYVSPTSTSVLGITPEEFIGKSAFDYIHPDDAEKVLAGLQRISNEKKVMLEPFRFQNKKKEWRWVETVLTNMLDNPVVNGIVANSRDVTDKIEEKHKLKLLESVVTNTKDAILITEAEPQNEPGPKIIYVNKAFTKMTGYEAEEIIGKTPRILQGPNSNAEDLEKLGRALRNWEPYEITTINYKKNGEEFWINFNVTPVANEKGWYTHWIAIERDITEHKIKELEKDLVDKISDIFHESNENDLIVCLTNLCEHIAKYGDFDFAEVWLPNIDYKTINRVTAYIQGDRERTFQNRTKNITSYSFGEGMPGYVWQMKSIEIWENIDERWPKVSKEDVNKSGIVTMMGVPLKHKEKVIGILLLGTDKPKSALTFNSELFQKLESTIGAELNRKKIEIELTQIFNFTPDMICVAGFDGYLKRINPAGLELLGYSLEEMLSRPIKSFVHEKDRPLTVEKQTALYNGANMRHFENRYITKLGKTVWLSWSATSAPEQGIVYAVAKNITEEKKLRELHQHTGRLAKIGSWEVDLVNQRVFWSNQIYQIHETDPNSFVPNMESWMNFYREDFRSLAQSKLKDCFEQGISVDFETVIVTPTKTEKWVRIIGSAEMVDGRPIRVFGSVQDIHSLKQMELKLIDLNKELQQYTLELERSNEDLEQFAFITSHDLQEPLRMVSTFMDQLKRNYKDQLDEKAHRYIDFATDGAKRMKHIILDLLDYSRAKSPTEGKEKVDVNQLLSEFRKLRRKLIAEKKATITSNNLPTLYTYKAAITQIFHCIIDNAIKYSTDGTPPIVEIYAEENDQDWQFSIQDNGIGIEPQFHEKIFIIFKRLHNKDEYDGSGIGLSIAKRHIEFLGGQIRLKSVPGEGTIFYFTIPKINV